MIIIKVPGLNAMGKNKGCRNAGNAILTNLKDIKSNEQEKIINSELLDLEEIHVDNANVEEQEKLIYENSLDAFSNQDQVIFLGGDHSISYSIGKAFLDYCKQESKKPCLIVFDAHPDLMEPMKEPTHEEWLRALIEYGFSAENILLVGNRNSHRKEIEFIKKNKIKSLSMNNLNEDLQDSCDTIMEFANGKELYVSIDIDVVDPAFAPATGYCEPGGLTSRQMIYLVSRINKMKNLKAVDIVEINSEKDKTGLTVKLGAKLLGEFI